jgi:hypothetical protein
VRVADVSSAIAELHWPPYAARVQGAPVGPESPTGPHPAIPARPAPAADSPRAGFPGAGAPAAASSAAASPEPPAPAAVSRFADEREADQHEAAAREAVARAIEAHAAEAREAAAPAADAHDASAPEPPAAARAAAAQREPVNERGAAQRGAAGEPVGKLLVATEGRTVQEVPLRIGRLIVGRTPDNDVHIDSRFVSRHHCQITTTANSCVIEDLNSTNGVYVKSARVRRHYLNDGDVVLIGKHELIYMDDRAGRGRASAPESGEKRAAESAGPELRSAPAGDAGDHSEDSRRAGG